MNKSTKTVMTGDIRYKHKYYLREMRALDSTNKEIKEQIKRVENHLSSLNKKLNEGRQLREKYRRKVGVYKKMYRNENKFKTENNIAIDKM